MAEIGHGGKEIVERIMDPAEAKEKIKGLTQIPIRSQIANEVIGLTYGFFTPLEGFMDKADVDSVCKKMRLANGVVWSIPILFDSADEEIQNTALRSGNGSPDLRRQPHGHSRGREIFDYDKKEMCDAVYGTDDAKHPGCARSYAYKDKFLGGKVTLVNGRRSTRPTIPTSLPPLEMRKRFKEKGWERIVAHQTRNVPHTGHEWLMKGAWFQTYAELPSRSPLSACS